MPQMLSLDAPRPIQVEDYAIRSVQRSELLTLLARAGVFFGLTLIIVALCVLTSPTLGRVWISALAITPFVLFRLFRMRKRWRISVRGDAGRQETIRVSQEAFGPAAERSAHEVDDRQNDPRAHWAFVFGMFAISFPLTICYDARDIFRLATVDQRALKVMLVRACAAKLPSPTLQELRDLVGQPIAPLIRVAMILPGTALMERAEGTVLIVNLALRRRLCGLRAE